ncbi:MULTISPECIES: hypothetical protein [unclassified Acinetobacter]
MPKEGTKLTLTIDDNLDNTSKVDYFLQALFSKLIVWQEIAITRDER